jgi:hypothetical protein
VTTKANRDPKAIVTHLTSRIVPTLPNLACLSWFPCGRYNERAHQLADAAAFPEPDGEDVRGRYWRPGPFDPGLTVG